MPKEGVFHAMSTELGYTERRQGERRLSQEDREQIKAKVDKVNAAPEGECKIDDISMW
jgi:hypothetical protein